MTEPSAIQTQLEETAELHTFLIADVQGYTHFTEERGDQAGARLAMRFAELAEEVVRAWHGRVVELRGDEVLAVFESARSALHAAVALQTRIGEVQRRGEALKVRVGVDAGDAVPVRGGYRGGALNTAARLQAIAGAGEVLTTDTVVGLARKAPGLVYLDRGEVLLKGLSEPVRVTQVVAQDEVPLQVEKFAVDVTPPINLPATPTDFIGRERELREIAALVQSDEVRLLTLTGPGGIGKTRLAIEAARAAAESFEHGVFFVPLASARDVDSALHAIGQAVGLPETAEQTRLTAIKNYFRGKHALLVLDNSEQIVDVGQYLADLLSDSPRLTILATSRMPFHIYGERQYLVPSMTVPGAAERLDLDQLLSYEAVRLFQDRARLVRPGFAITDDNAEAVAEICRRLDGLPLAIELAAARITIFPPRELLARLDHRLKLLKGGPRNLPARQQTLRDAITWSYDLLEEPEKALFCRLSVFVGGFTLEGAEAVCAAQGDLDIDVLEGLASLIDKSLVQQNEAPGPSGYPESRFSMLQVIQEFAREQVSDEQWGALQRNHAHYFLDLAERSHEKLMSARRDSWREMWNAEWGNVRAMLQWSLEARQPEVGLPVAALLWVWCWLDGPAEMRDWMNRLLALPEAQQTTRAVGLGYGGAASMAYYTGHLDEVPALSARAVEIGRACGDKWLLAGALMQQAISSPSPLTLLDEARRLYGELGNPFGRGFAAVAAVRATLTAEDQRIVGDWLDEALKDFRRTGDVFGEGLVLRATGTLAIMRGQFAEARGYLEEALERFRTVREKRYFPLVLLTLGGISRMLGEVERARKELTTALTFVHEQTDRGSLASCLEGLAAVAVDQGQIDRSVRLWADARVLRDTCNSAPFPMADIFIADLGARIEAAVGEDAFEAAIAEARGIPEEEMVDFGLKAVGW